MRISKQRARAQSQHAQTCLARSVVLLAASVLVHSGLAAPAGPLRLASELSGYVDGLSADIGSLVSANFSHIIVGGGNGESTGLRPSAYARSLLS